VIDNSKAWSPAGNKKQLSDAIAYVYLERVAAEVDQYDPDLAPIVRIDQTRPVDDCDPVFRGEA